MSGLIVSCPAFVAAVFTHLVSGPGRAAPGVALVNPLNFPQIAEKEMATHSSVLAWRIQGRGAAVYGVAQSQTGLSS